MKLKTTFLLLLVSASAFCQSFQIPSGLEYCNDPIKLQVEGQGYYKWYNAPGGKQ